MKTNPLITLLTVVLLLGVLATAALCFWFIQSTRELHRMQARVVAINRQGRPFLQALANDTVEYSKRNPAIDPVLQAVGFKPRTPAQTQQAAGAPKPANR